ncbi:MAG: aminotransferase [Desulfobacteraceae bacterium]|nr:aminotransferase [Desulfobacteraceae bacterium]
MDRGARTPFSKDFTQQEPIPEDAIQQAVNVLRTGRLHRYNTMPDGKSETTLLEEEFSDYQGSEYCLACASCGSALYLALKSAGVHTGDKVLCNAFTLAPVPGAIENTNADIVLVDIKEDYTIDLDDLDRKAERSGAKYLLLSHMRGHITDMDIVRKICSAHKLFLIEDCAHTMGASWANRKSGTFGDIACFSTQTYKHMNSGEGGLLTTNHPAVAARAIIFSGSYMLYKDHTRRPDLKFFEVLKTQVPNYSCRMDNLRAAILRPQLRELDDQCERWNTRYHLIENKLKAVPGLFIPERDVQEQFIGSSIQFSLPGQDGNTILAFIENCREQGVVLKWFGAPEPDGYTSVYKHWQYMNTNPELMNADRILATMCDMRIPLTFTDTDCLDIAAIISQTAGRWLKD